MDDLIGIAAAAADLWEWPRLGHLGSGRHTYLQFQTIQNLCPHSELLHFDK